MSLTISELEQQLRDAEEQCSLICHSGNTSLIEQLEAYENVSNAQRALARAKGEEYAVQYHIGLKPEAAVSAALLLQTEEDGAFLTFSAVQLAQDGSLGEWGYAVVQIEGCLITKFGHPNDEALEGHPLYNKGLGAYDVYEVMNSAWIRQMTEINRVRFPDRSDWILDMKHFIFVFHDSTFECIAEGLRASFSTEPYKKIFAQLSAQLFDYER